MTYLVTGATGFVGTTLVEHLLEQGEAVYYLARKRSQTLPSQASFHPWDTSRKPDLTALSRIDVIFHLAGESVAQRWTPEVKKKIHDTRVIGTRNLVAAVGDLKHKPATLVSASAVGYYGDRGSAILTERENSGSDFLAKVCGEWEHEALRAREIGLRVVPLRIGTVLGREGGAIKAMLPPFKLGLGARFGDGKQWMSWIHIQDLIRLFLFAANDARLQGPVNAASPEPVTNAQFTKALAGALHRPAFFPVPEFALKMFFGEMADFFFTSSRVAPEAAEQAGFRFDFPKLEDALQAIF